ncbi:MAG: hypothetical protein LBL90_07450 [Prevotellaceae bacterium]|jgi:hypothetical protein|nr:hypothetical protein [Prevotellaceae bacterium]
MKKIVFITISVLFTCLLTSFDLQAQNSKVEDFITKHSSQKGASYVEMSKAMLDAAFANSFGNWGGGGYHVMWNKKDTEAPKAAKKYPTKFKSLVLKDVANVDELSKIISGGQYEVLMKVTSNKEDKKTKESYESTTTHYFHNSNKADEKEIVIVQQDGNNRLAITYMQGNLEIDNLQNYLRNIRVKLSTMGISSSLTSSLDFNFNDLKFDFDFNDWENFKIINLDEFEKLEFEPVIY